MVKEEFDLMEEYDFKPVDVKKKIPNYALPWLKLYLLEDSQASWA